MDPWLVTLNCFLDPSAGPVARREPEEAYYRRYGRSASRLSPVAPLAALIGLVVVAALGSIPH